eukprot:GILJ01033616.1.p2 GENE.GILJ01033616.1~~GILJ01033616.1.p2  ORF type:complete len:205 (-),score=10.94 GILJ01033616.1:344-958(-)
MPLPQLETLQILLLNSARAPAATAGGAPSATNATQYTITASTPTAGNARMDTKTTRTASAPAPSTETAAAMQLVSQGTAMPVALATALASGQVRNAINARQTGTCPKAALLAPMDTIITPTVYSCARYRTAAAGRSPPRETPRLAALASAPTHGEARSATNVRPTWTPQRIVGRAPVDLQTILTAESPAPWPTAAATPPPSLAP